MKKIMVLSATLAMLSVFGQADEWVPDSTNRCLGPTMEEWRLPPTVVGQAIAGWISLADTKTWTVNGNAVEFPPAWYGVLAILGSHGAAGADGHYDYDAVPAGQTRCFFAQWNNTKAYQTFQHWDGGHQVGSAHRDNLMNGTYEFLTFTDRLESTVPDPIGGGGAS